MPPHHQGCAQTRARVWIGDGHGSYSAMDAARPRDQVKLLLTVIKTRRQT